MSKEHDAGNPALRSPLEHEADEVARLHEPLLRQAPGFRQVLADLAGHEDEVFCPSRARDVDLRHKRVLEPLF